MLALGFVGSFLLFRIRGYTGIGAYPEPAGRVSYQISGKCLCSLNHFDFHAAILLVRIFMHYSIFFLLIPT